MESLMAQKALHLLLLTLALLFALLDANARSGATHEYRIRVQELLMGPVTGISIGPIASDRCLNPIMTDSLGIVTIHCDQPLVGVIVADPQLRYLPTTFYFSQSRDEYVVQLERAAGTRVKAEEILNELIEIIAASGEFSDLASKTSSGHSGVVYGVPGVFSLAPSVRNGEIYFTATGVIAEFLAAYLPAVTGTRYGSIQL
jgi:hypothetical protein